MEELHLHERLNKALDILNGLGFKGYHEITQIAPKVGLAMTELILLEQDVAKFELENAAKEAPKDEQQT